MPPMSSGADAVELPERIPDSLRQAVGKEPILAWAEYNLDPALTYTTSFLVLTECGLYGLSDDASLRIEQVRSASIHSMRGYDYLAVSGEDGALLFRINYTRRYRSEINDLKHQLDGLLERRSDQRSDVSALSESRSASKPEPSSKTGHLIRRMLPFARPYRRRLWLALVLTMIMAGLSAVPPYCYLHLIDDGIRAGNPEAVIFWGSLVAGVVITRELIGAAYSLLIDYIGVRFTEDLRQTVFSHLQTLGLRYFQKRRTGNLISRVTGDTGTIWPFIILYYVDLIRDGTMIMVAAVIMFSINWWLAILALFPLPLLGGLIYWRHLRMKGLVNAVRYFSSKLSAVAVDVIPGIRVVKAFGGEARESKRFSEAHQELSWRRYEYMRKWVVTQPMFTLLMNFASLGIWLLGGTVIANQVPSMGETITLGVLTAFVSYLGQFYSPVIRMAGSYRQVLEMMAGAYRILDVLNSEPEIESKPDATRIQRSQGAFELSHVDFSYDRVKLSLKDVSLSVEPGEMIGVCGPSGAGKSTLINLLCRFYDPTHGNIYLDGCDLRDYHLEDLRRNIGVVLQEPYLFYGSVAENIRYGNPDASPQQVINAARAAEAHDFIMRLDNGYDSIIGERGLTLSGGERQRLSIARALIKDPAVLILDEATSSLDVETEARIRSALERLVKGRTTFAIAHRLSTLRSANRLIVLDEGRLVEVGTHAELLSNPEGIYKKMHEKQRELSELVAVAG